jgi:hypothetical protein
MLKCYVHNLENCCQKPIFWQCTVPFQKFSNRKTFSLRHSCGRVTSPLGAAYPARVRLSRVQLHGGGPSPPAYHTRYLYFYTYTYTVGIIQIPNHSHMNSRNCVSQKPKIALLLFLKRSTLIHLMNEKALLFYLIYSPCPC